MGTRISRRDFLVTSRHRRAAVSPPLKRAEAQDKRTLVVAWDSDIDTLDPAAFKSQGGYVTVANTTDAPIMWKVRPDGGQAGALPLDARGVGPAPGGVVDPRRTTARRWCSRSAAA